MTYDEFKHCLQLANLSIRELAVLLHMQPNSITNYRAKGKVPRHLEVIAKLLAALAAHGVDGSALLKRISASSE